MNEINEAVGKLLKAYPEGHLTFRLYTNLVWAVVHDADGEFSELGIGDTIQDAIAAAMDAKVRSSQRALERARARVDKLQGVLDEAIRERESL